MYLARKLEQVSDKPRLVTVSWYSPNGAPPPPGISALAPALVTDFRDLHVSSVCFLDCADRELCREVPRLRQTYGDALYIVANTDCTDTTFQAELFDHGVDDILLQEGPEHLLRCLLRARRHLTLLQAQERRLDDLQDQLDRWQDGLDHLPTPIYLKDADGRYVGCNTAFSMFVGRTRDALIGLTLADILPQEVAEAHWQSDLEVVRTGGVLRVETDVCLPESGMRHVMLHKASIASRDGHPRGIAGVMIDITERKELEARLTAAAERDPLTNAYNRRKFFQVAASAIEHCQDDGSAFAVAVIDIDHFKSINDELGHGEGDLTLCSIVDTLRSHESDGVLIARAGGEEFFAFFAGEIAGRAAELLEQMRIDVARYCQVMTGAGAAGTISIGLAAFDPEQETVDQALRRADLALYRAKRDGRNRLSVAP